MRNYKKEYANYQGTTTQKKNRASRNAARNTLKKAGVVKRGDGKDVNHRNGNPKDILVRPKVLLFHLMLV